MYKEKLKLFFSRCKRYRVTTIHTDVNIEKGTINVFFIL